MKEGSPYTRECYKFFPDLLRPDPECQKEQRVCFPFLPKSGWFDLAKYSGLDDECHYKFALLNPGDESFSESSARLMEGTLNLLNCLIAQSQLGRTINTLVYLDKSGRLAAYLLDVVWRTVQKTGYVFPITRPKIRFINIGSGGGDKYKDRHSRHLLAQRYHPADLNDQNVMIVDEYCASGDSVRNAAEALLSAGYHPNQMVGISQFARFLPGWYTRNRVKGVADVFDAVFDTDLWKLTSLEPGLIDRTLALSQIIGIRKLISLFKPQTSTSLFRDHLTAYQQQKLIAADIDLVNFRTEFTTGCETIGLSISPVLCNIISYGDFTAFPPESENMLVSASYRQTLRFMVEAAFTRGLVQIE